MKVKYSYNLIYNTRPDELYGMGKESLNISGEGDLLELLKNIELNSSLKHENAYDFIIIIEKLVEREEWKKYIGQPKFFITDIKIEQLND